ncbi:MAG: tRNA lysidine(34) synthetase TilS [Bacteroidetes bacterium]|nr:tRNA lysidine(34) synthetase TilS [Bacteroidota bacterium]
MILKQNSSAGSSSLHLYVLQKFQSHVAQWCKTTDKILLAVSGGLDSMAMLDLFAKSGFTVAVAHVNFQLRGAESDEDERWLSAFCERKNIPFHSTRFHTNNYAISKSLSIQMAARELRYEWFGQLRKVEKMDWVATAHHHNDSIETFLLNLAKGTSIHGLQGIAPVHGYLLRPLLFATRQELTEYVAAQNIPWREDESNQSDDYQRNFIRHQLVPRFLEINPAFETSMGKTIDKLEGTLQLVNKAVDDWKALHVRNVGDACHIAKGGLTDDNGESYHVAVLWELLKDYGFHFDQCRQIYAAKSGQPGKKFLTTTHELVIDRDDLILVPITSDFTHVSIEKDQKEAIQAGKKLVIQKVRNTNEIDRSKSNAALDTDRIQFPVIWRKWKAGDWFVPLGMKNRKKVSDFLIDEKVSVAEKESVTVLESAGEIMWVVGHRIDDRFKVVESTSNVHIFQLVNHDKNQ